MSNFLARAAALCAIVYFPVLACAQPTIFTRILTNSSVLPPDDRPLNHFVDNDAPTRWGNSIAFSSIPSFANELPRLFRWDNGNVSFIAGPQTPIPGSTSLTSSIAEPSISGTDTAFTMFGGPNQDGGICRISISTLSLIVDIHTTPPGATSPFIRLETPLIDGPTTTFLGAAPGQGIYRKRNSDLIRIADSNTVFPGMGMFNGSLLSHSRGGGYNAFLAGFNNPDGEGIYEIDPTDHVSLIADTHTIPPGRTTPFLEFRVPAIDGPDAAFIAQIAPAKYGLYRRVSGSMQLVAQDGQAAPGGGFLFFEAAMNRVSISQGHLAVLAGADPFGAGIYTDVGGTFHKVIRAGESLDGKVVEFLRMNNDALDGESLVFLVDFTDGSQALYMATVPEPALIALASLVVLTSRRRHTQLQSVPSSQAL